MLTEESMTMIEFQKSDESKECFESISHFHQISFCASLSERILPNYNLLDRDSNIYNFPLLRKSLDEIWDSLIKNELDLKKIQNISESCEALISETDNNENLASLPEAENAVACLCYTLDLCLHPNEISLIIQAINTAHISFDYYFQNMIFICLDNNLNQEEIVDEFGMLNLEYILPFIEIDKRKYSYSKRSEKITEQLSVMLENHPWILTEIEKENEDLRQLQESSILTPELLIWLRTSSENGGKSFLDIC
jgi:uncharacterized protein